MGVIVTNEFRNGSRLELDNEPYIIVEFQHVKPGKGGSFVRTKLKSLKSGAVIERTFRTGEKFDEPDIEEKNMQFLYTQDSDYIFMDTENYEQISLSKAELGDRILFLKEQMIATILFYRGKAITVDLPLFVELAIAETDPGRKGDTASGGSKPAKLESGAVVKVPFHLQEGDVVKVDTRTGDYIERVKTAS
ncbi:MAG: elongation factor P [Leptospirillum sp.]|jgi:elongation factor P|nr:elongation factor P [Nitrospiraceae bacterium]